MSRSIRARSTSSATPTSNVRSWPSRCSRRAAFATPSSDHRKKGIKKPKDLEGKRIGVPLCTMTAAIFIRGLLQHEYGVDFSKCTWVQGAINTAGAHGGPAVLPLLKPIKIEQNRSAPR